MTGIATPSLTFFESNDSLPMLLVLIQSPSLKKRGLGEILLDTTDHEDTKFTKKNQRKIFVFFVFFVVKCLKLMSMRPE